MTTSTCARAFVMTGALVCVAAFGLSAAAQQRPSFSYEVVIESAGTIDDTLRDLTRQGYTCAAVARPVGGRLSNNVAVIVSRPSDWSPSSSRASAKRSDVEVITATAGTPQELEARMNAAAQEGFTLCGLTMTESIWGQPAEYATVAVMTRAGTSPTGSSYRVVRSRARREEWTMLERAAAEGFVVSRHVSRPQYQAAANTSDIVFIAEKTARSQPTRYELAFAGNGPALEKEIAKSTKRGYCVQTAWSTFERMSVLLAKPLDSACERQHEYEVEESSRFSISSADGEMIAMSRMKEGVMALYNGRDTSVEYSVIENIVLPDPEVRRIFRPREHRLFAEKLDADGERGFRVIDVTWRDAGRKDGRTIDVILSRPRQ